jgi:hypothetical protein
MHVLTILMQSNVTSWKANRILSLSHESGLNIGLINNGRDKELEQIKSINHVFYRQSHFIYSVCIHISSYTVQ